MDDALQAEHEALQADPDCPPAYRTARFIGARWSDFHQAAGIFGLPNPQRMDLTPLDRLDEAFLPDVETARHYRFNTVLIEHRSAANRVGMGVFVAPDLVLTAAHNAEFWRMGGGASANFLRSQGVGGGPGRFHFPKTVHVARGWVEGPSHASDLALIRTRTPHPDFEPVDMQDHTSMALGGIAPSAPTGPLFLSAFWRKVRDRRQAFTSIHLSSGSVIEPSLRVEGRHVLASHDAKTLPGWSGSPIYVMPKTQGPARLSGIHVHGDPEANLFAAFTPALAEELATLGDERLINPHTWPVIWSAS